MRKKVAPEHHHPESPVSAVGWNQRFGASATTTRIKQVLLVLVLVAWAISTSFVSQLLSRFVSSPLESSLPLHTKQAYNSSTTTIRANLEEPPSDNSMSNQHAKIIASHQQKDMDLPSSSSFSNKSRLLLISGNVTLQNVQQQLYQLPYRFMKRQHKGPADNVATNKQSSRRIPQYPLVIGILTLPQNYDRRQVIRQTWARKSALHRKGFQIGTPLIYFLVAGNWTPALEQEFHKHSDLFHLQVPEGYYTSLTPKVFAFMQVMHQHFKYQYLLKTDDDSYVRLGKLLLYLRNWYKRKEQPIMTGYCLHKFRVNRNASSPDYIPESVLPSHLEIWPPFAAGAGYILSYPATTCVARNIATYPHLPPEDANVGFLLSLPTCRPLLVTSNTTPPCTTMKSICISYKEARNNFLLQHHMTPEQINQTYERYP